MYTYGYSKERGLLVGLLHGAQNSDADYQGVADTITRLIEDARGSPAGTACILVVEPGNPRPDATWRQRFAKLQARAIAETARHLFVLVTDSPLIRGVLTAVRWVSPTPPHEAVARATFEEAARWIQAQRGEELPDLRDLLKEALSKRAPAARRG